MERCWSWAQDLQQALLCLLHSLSPSPTHRVLITRLWVLKASSTSRSGQHAVKRLIRNHLTGSLPFTAGYSWQKKKETGGWRFIFIFRQWTPSLLWRNSIWRRHVCHRSEGCILPNPNSSRTKALPWICSEWDSLSVKNSWFGLSTAPQVFTSIFMLVLPWAHKLFTLTYPTKWNLWTVHGI